MSDDLKAGAAISRQNMTRLQSMHDMSVAMGAQCDTPGYDTTPIGKAAACLHCGQPLVTEDTAAKAGLMQAEDHATHYATMKAVGDRLLEVKVAYYGHKNGKDAHNEFFSPNTDFAAEDFPAPPLLYYHGYTETNQKASKPIVTGKFVSRRAGGDGHYLTYKLKSGKYADKQYDAALKGECVVSPGTIGHLIRKDASGELIYWPLAEISAWDYAASREPANLHSVAAPVLKALYLSEGLTLPTTLDAPETAGEAVAGVADTPLTSEQQAALIESIVTEGLRTYRKETSK